VNLRLVRIRIFELSVQEQLQSGPLVGQIEVDESYFGARRVKGKRGRGARGKSAVKQWVRHYKDEGIDGLKEKQRSGRPSKARNQNHTKLLQSILAMQNNKNGV
jgi:hypothetical protein